MIIPIVVNIRRNNTNHCCTDAETDCSFLSYIQYRVGNETAYRTMCSLYGKIIDDGACEQCDVDRKKVTDFLEHFQKQIDELKAQDRPTAIRIMEPIFAEALALLGAKEPFCLCCCADPGDDSVCANCRDYELFKEKKA